MLWVDKHRPKNISQLTYHPELTQRLAAISSNAPCMPHTLFYGPSGSGKKTRISCLLRAIFGPGAEKLRLDRRSFKTPTSTERTIEINMLVTNYHVEMSPGDAGNDDRYVVQDVIKEMAQNRSVAGRSGNNGSVGKAEYKIVLLVDVDRLSRPAQAALRRTMEKYATTCRIIICCQNPSKVIEPVRSRCLNIRVPAPSHDDIVNSLQQIARKENFAGLTTEVFLKIARDSGRNMRRSVLSLETLYVQQRGRDAPETLINIPRTDWEMYITQLAVDITKEQSPQRLLAAREKLYELLINCIPPTMIIKTLAMELCKNLDDELKHDVLEWAAFYEHRICLGSKDIFHLEAFVAKYMSLYKQYLNALFA